MVDTQARPVTPAALHDLRGWLAAVEAAGELRTITAEVDPIEEMSAVSYLTSRSEAAPAIVFTHSEAAPAIVFTHVRGGRHCVRSLFNLTGASRVRLALAMGLAEHDPSGRHATGKEG